MREIQSMGRKMPCPGLCEHIPLSHILKNKNKTKQNKTKQNHICLTPFGLLYKAIDCVAYEQQKFTFNSSGGWEIQGQDAHRCGVW